MNGDAPVGDMPGGRTGSVIGAALPDHEELVVSPGRRAACSTLTAITPRLRDRARRGRARTPGVDELVLLADHAAAQPLALQREPRAGHRSARAWARAPPCRRQRVLGHREQEVFIVRT